MANPASRWRQQGWYDEAKRLEVKVLELQKEIRGTKDPNMISAMANLEVSNWFCDTEANIGIEVSSIPHRHASCPVETTPRISKNLPKNGLEIWET